MEQGQRDTAARPEEVKAPVSLPEVLLALMSRVERVPAEYQYRTKSPAVIQAKVSDKDAVLGKAVVIDGKKT